MSTENVSKNSEQEHEEKINSFLKEYGELVQKHQIDFASYPQYVPSSANPGEWGVKIVTVPISVQQPVLSPKEFISKE